MKVLNGIEAAPDRLGPVVASIGNYDGVHVGHRAILSATLSEAERRGLPSLLITFDPHPMRLLAPDRGLRLLQTRRQKLDRLESLGLDYVLLLEFDRALAALDGPSFFQFLGRDLRFAAIHVGENFRFGQGRSGNLELLRSIGAEAGFDVSGMPAVELAGATVSSSAIRQAVSAGDVEGGARMLGRPYAVRGIVVHGEGRGRTLDFPTANIAVENEILPSAGVYITETLALASRHPSVTNIGVRPTFGDDSALTVESHLLEFSEDIYDEQVELRFLARIRDEMTFDGPHELADQIARDRAAAGSFFHNMQIRST